MNMNSMRLALLKTKDTSHFGDMIRKAEVSTKLELELKRKEELASLQKEAKALLEKHYKLTKQKAKRTYESKIYHFLNNFPTTEISKFKRAMRILLKGKAGTVQGVYKINIESPLMYIVKMDKEISINSEKFPELMSAFFTASEKELSLCTCRGYLPNHKRCSPRRRQKKQAEKWRDNKED